MSPPERDNNMKNISRLASLVGALMLMLGLLTAAPTSVSAGEVTETLASGSFSTFGKNDGNIGSATINGLADVPESCTLTVSVSSTNNHSVHTGNVLTVKSGGNVLGSVPTFEDGAGAPDGGSWVVDRSMLGANVNIWLAINQNNTNPGTSAQGDFKLTATCVTPDPVLYCHPDGNGGYTIEEALETEFPNGAVYPVPSEGCPTPSTTTPEEPTTEPEPEPEPEPTDPPVITQVCNTDGTVTVTVTYPEDAAFFDIVTSNGRPDYETNGNVITFTENGDGVAILASAVYDVDGDLVTVDDRVEVTASAELLECEEPVTTTEPQPTPTTQPEPTPTTQPNTTPTTTPEVEELAYTGSETPYIAGFGILLMAAGFGLRTMSKRNLAL